MSNHHNSTRENPNDFQRGYYGEKNFALTGKIMMSAIIILFTVVLLILCLHIYARWLLLRSRRNHRRRRTNFVFSGEDNGQIPTTNPAQRGLELSTLQTLPIFVFTTSTHKDGLECSVCLCEFEENEKGRVLPKCKHSFHIDCIDMWFHSHSTCPLCRTAVKPYFPAPGNLTPVLGQIPVEEALEASPSHVELCSSCRPREESCSSSSLGVKGSISEEVGSSSSSTCSSSSLQKGWAITVEVPRRTESFRVPGDDSAISPGLKSSMSRMLSLKRILSRDRKASLGVSFSFSSETDLEQSGGEHR